MGIMIFLKESEHALLINLYSCQYSFLCYSYSKCLTAIDFLAVPGKAPVKAWDLLGWLGAKSIDCGPEGNN